ncbi:MAG: hypothetical protein CL677_03570 [Bdellovibrionaceae bacterium]|nr:hypothetical protein [Pseudobdellovibrionaceae bacterium]|tara:strand:+ start:307 stop:1137 length:831 start_codon:yes stop_codon:yes gene_type:complete
MSGYDDFFKKAKSANKTKVNQRQRVKIPDRGHKRADAQAAAPATSAEKQLRELLVKKSELRKQQKRKESKPPAALIASCLMGMVFAGLGFLYPEYLVDSMEKVEISFFGQSQAQEAAAPPAAAPKDETAKVEKPAETTENKASVSSEDMSYFKKLNQRKEELDQREESLVKLEEELHKQKVEIEKRIGELQKIRDQIAATLKEKKTVDEEKIAKLVDFYSNMKPKSAAKVLMDIDEELAVEILGNMKKKNAAAIMNLLEPKKAQNLSEKFAGYRRK